MATFDESTKHAFLTKIHSLEESLKCKICSCLLREPMLIQKCGHSSCRACVGPSSLCPVCGASACAPQPDRQLQEVIAQLLRLRERLTQEKEESGANHKAQSTPGTHGKKKVGPATSLRANQAKEAPTRTSQKEEIVSSTPRAGLRKRHSAPPTLTPIQPKGVSKGGRGRAPTPQLNKRNPKGETVLHRAVIKGDVARVQQLVEQGAEVNTQDNNGWTPLHEASNHGHLEMARVLLECGALPNAASFRDLVTPLHDALLNGYQMGMATLLASRGADLHARTTFGYTALDLCKNDEDRRMLEEACSPFIEGSTLNITRTTAVADGQADVVVLLPSGLGDQQRALLQQAAPLLDADIADEYSDRVSHVVVSCDAEGNCTRTMKVLLAMMGGKWILSTKWLEVCVEYGRRVSEDPFEAQGTKNQPSTQGPHKARLNALHKRPPLLSGLQIYLHGPFTAPTPCREELRNLIHAGGGKLLSREPRHTSEEEENASIGYHISGTPLEATPSVILYQDRPPRDTHLNGGGVCTSQAMWLVACISHFAILPPQQTGLKEK